VQPKVYAQSRSQAAFALVAGMAGIALVLFAVNLALQWPTWLLIVIIGALAAGCWLGLQRVPVEVRIDSRGLAYSGGIPPRRVVVRWDQVRDVRVGHEPAAFGAPPVLSKLVLKSERSPTLTIGREVGDLAGLADAIAGAVEGLLLKRCLKAIDAGHPAQFGPLSVDRRTGVSLKTLLAKGTVPLEQVRRCSVETPGGGASAAGAMAGMPILRIEAADGKVLAAALEDIPNSGVLVALLSHLLGRKVDRAGLGEVERTRATT
jgi:hypothetical protein